MSQGRTRRSDWLCRERPSPLTTARAKFASLCRERAFGLFGLRPYPLLHARCGNHALLNEFVAQCSEETRSQCQRHRGRLGSCRALQCEYLLDNPILVGFESFRRVYEGIDPVLRDLTERFGYYDLFLIEREQGRIVYSAVREVDLATSLRTGPYRESHLARVFEAAVSASNARFVALVDFDFYVPSNGVPAAFIAAPIFDAGESVGVLAFQLSLNRASERLLSVVTSLKSFIRIDQAELQEADLHEGI